MTDNVQQTNDGLWKLKVATFLGWTAFVTALTGSFIILLAKQPPLPGQTLDDHHTDIGCAAMMVMGCSGGVWFGGLVAIFLIFAILRR